jgi:hypothetical protein
VGRLWERGLLGACPMVASGSDVERGGGFIEILVVLVLITILEGARCETERSDGNLGGVRGGISEDGKEEDGEGEDEDEAGVAGNQSEVAG